MSTVQLSGAVAERLRARRSAPHRGRSGACRALFGPVDHEELDRDMESKLSEMCARDRHRWNFDFETDTPLYGGYAWEALGVQEMPVFYRECVRRGARSIRVAQREQPRDMVAREERAVHGGCPGTERLADAEEVRPKENMNSQNVGCTAAPHRAPKRSASAGAGSTSTTRMTDYYAKKRRPSAVKPDVPAEQVTVERAPRKRIR